MGGTANPHVDWDQEHADREAAGQEGRHKEWKEDPATVNQVARRGITGKPRPGLHYYTDEQVWRFRFRADADNQDAVVVRVQNQLDPADNPKVGEGDPDHGLFVLDTGEVVISLNANGGQPVRFEFKVFNPGDGLGDYKC